MLRRAPPAAATEESRLVVAGTALLARAESMVACSKEDKTMERGEMGVRHSAVSAVSFVPRSPVDKVVGFGLEGWLSSLPASRAVKILVVLQVVRLRTH